MATRRRSVSGLGRHRMCDPVAQTLDRCAAAASPAGRARGPVPMATDSADVDDPRGRRPFAHFPFAFLETTSRGLDDHRPGVHRLVRRWSCSSRRASTTRSSQPLRPDSDEFLHVIAVDVSGRDPFSQQSRHPHQRRAVLSGDARRHSRGRVVGQHGGVYLPAGRGGGHARRGAWSIAPGPASRCA